MRAFTFSLAILLHGILLLCAFLTIERTSSKLIGAPQEKNLTTYLYEMPAQKVVSAEPEKKQPEAPKTDKGIALTVKKVVRLTQKQTSGSVRSKSKGLPIETLLGMLHSAIQQHQQYPLAAQLMEREGRVTVQFMLLPDGQIKALTLLKSSGTESLDQAALLAVKSAAPFTEVRKYLTETKTFSIDLVFELS